MDSTATTSVQVRNWAFKTGVNPTRARLTAMVSMVTSFKIVRPNSARPAHRKGDQRRHSPAAARMKP